MEKQQKSLLNKILSGFCLVLSIIGLLSLLVLSNFLLSTKKISDSYEFLLSQKLRQQSYFHKQENYNSEFGKEKNFGEFCYNFFGSEIKDGKIKLSLDEQKIRGIVYTNNNMYGAKIDPLNASLEIEDRPVITHWRWYNWLGFKMEKVHQMTLEEMVNQPLPSKNQ